MSAQVEDKGRIHIAAEIFEEHGRTIARWPQLRLSAHGDSRKEALDNLLNMVVAALVASIQRGDLGLMLKNAGVRIEPLLPGQRPPFPESISTLPHLVVQASDGSRTAA